MYLCADLGHIPAVTVISRPMILPLLVDRHRIADTFAPHFFLARLVQSMETVEPLSPTLDMSCLRHLISGGESNLVNTVAALAESLQNHNLRGDVVRSGFGLKETCAGSIYSKCCPTYDMVKGCPFASFGKPIPGIEMRIILTQGHRAARGDVGDLQLAAKLVFKDYFNVQQQPQPHSQKMAGLSRATEPLLTPTEI